MNHPRKQAKQARSRATQDAILEATARIIEEQGRANLNTNNIAARAGVSIGSLYQYFPNKEAIVATLLRNKRDELLQRMGHALRDADQMTPAQTIDALIRAGLSHQFSRPKLALELEYMEPDLDLGDESDALAREIAALVFGTVQRIAPGSGPEEARDVVAICKGILNAASLAGEPDGEDLYRRCSRAVTGYLGVTSP